MKNKGTKRKKSVPWWTKLCSTTIQARNKAFRKVRKMYIFDDLILYLKKKKKAQANVRRVIRDAKNNFWINYCNSIGRM